MTPLDHLRRWFVGLDSDLQYEIAFALIPALEGDFKGRRFPRRSATSSRPWKHGWPRPALPLVRSARW